ncbi:MAG: stage V sporulation protein AA [Bacillota bacterium]|nr:stage V sporulation protein AA [Bacillota bacterium]
MKRVEIYIKPMEKIQAVAKKEILLQDIAELYAEGMILKDLERLPVFYVPQEEKKTYLLSVLHLVQCIHEKYPQAEVLNLGAADILIEYLPKERKGGRLWSWMKAVFVAAVLFVGAATTIMCFHTDVQLPLIFRNIYYIFYGKKAEMPLLLFIPYSIGLGLGIILFFNHFSSFSLTQDPTPIEIEMTTYEKETNASVIDQLGKGKGEQ